MAPYDDSLMTPELKASHACISSPELLGNAIAMPAPRDRAAADPIAALERQCDAFAKRGGKRHVFIFLHDMSGFDLKQDSAIERLKAVAQASSTVLHCICPDVAGKWALLRDLCLSNPEGSFTEAKLEGMVDGLVDVYANLCSRFEISYSLPASAEPGTVTLKISGPSGQAEMSLDISPVLAASEPVRATIAAPVGGSSAESQNLDSIR
jgi:hypothetical protein